MGGNNQEKKHGFSAGKIFIFKIIGIFKKKYQSLLR